MKNGLLSGMFGGGAPMRPVPRPDLAAPMAAAAAPGRGGFPALFSRSPGGILPERGSQTQYDLVTTLIQTALQAAPQSGSPLLAALAPMLGGAALSRVQGLRDIGQQREQDNAAAALFGRPMGESERALLATMSNENLPGFFRSEAENRLQAALMGVPTGAGGPRSGGGGGGGGTGGSPNPASAQPATVDDMAVLLGATDGGGLLTEPQRRTLFTILRNPDATSQERQLAQRLLERHDAAIRNGRENPTGLPAAPAVPTDAPTAPSIAPMPGAPAQDAPWWSPGTGGANPAVPPPPPGTVPY